MNTNIGIAILAGVFLLAVAAGQPQVSAQPAKPGPAKPASQPVGKAPKLPAGVKVLAEVAYAKVGDTSLPMEIYVPTESKGNLPVVVYIPGGAWRNLRTRDSLPNSITVAALAAHGYALVNIGHRLAQDVGAQKAAHFPAQIFDCKAAIRFVRANAAKYNFDADHIGVWGGSSGGHLAALLGTSGSVKELEGDVGDNLTFSSRVQCVADFSGPTDLVKLDAFCSHNYAPGRSPPVMLLGGPMAEHKDMAIKANPITFVTKDAPPFLITHGDKDPAVPINQSELLVDALKKVGVEVTFEVVKGGGHGPGTPAQEERINRLLVDFFDKHLKASATSQPAGEKTSN